MTYLIFAKFFKCSFVILIGYFLYIGDRLFKYLFSGIFIICQHFFKLLSIIFVMNFAFVNIFYLNNVSFGVDNVKTINGTFSMLWLRIFQIMDKKYLYLFLSHLKILSQHILQKQSSQFLKIIYFDFCNFSVFARLQKIQLILI